MGSTRLPGKMLMPLAGKPVVQWVFEQARAIVGVDSALLATTIDARDDPLAAFCKSESIPVFRGSPEDVLDRYYQAAKQDHSDVVIRITGDCPFLDPAESGKVLNLFLNDDDCDYASNVNPPYLPDGLDTEVMSFDALSKAWETARDLSDREHVTLFIRRHPKMFRLKSMTVEADLSSHRWTLDEPRDYEFLNEVAGRLVDRGMAGNLGEILQLLESEPDLMNINSDIGRNEGLAKSLEANPLRD
jgi:spore coat polysaccharide biosynthesis protein SpsF